VVFCGVGSVLLGLRRRAQGDAGCGNNDGAPHFFEQGKASTIAMSTARQPTTPLAA